VPTVTSATIIENKIPLSILTPCKNLLLPATLPYIPALTAYYVQERGSPGKLKTALRPYPKKRMVSAFGANGISGASFGSPAACVGFRVV